MLETSSRDLAVFRKFYACLVTATYGVTDPRIVSAFATVPREDFLGPGPWKIAIEGTYIETPSANPALLYQDIVVALIAERGVNNGEPSLHARSLGAVGVSEGEHVLQIGVGGGYYTAILAELVGAKGHVTAIEIDDGLAERAKHNLRHRPNVEVLCRSGAEGPLPRSDVIYVSAGATEPLRVWLEALAPKGRLIFPLTPGRGYGGMLLVTRGRRRRSFAARLIGRVGFIPMIGGQDERAVAGLAAVFKSGGLEAVRSLHLDTPPNDTCWYSGRDWWLSTEEG